MLNKMTEDIPDMWSVVNDIQCSVCNQEIATVRGMCFECDEAYFKEEECFKNEEDEICLWDQLLDTLD